MDFGIYHLGALMAAGIALLIYLLRQVVIGLNLQLTAKLLNFIAARLPKPKAAAPEAPEQRQASASPAASVPPRAAQVGFARRVPATFGKRTAGS